jgi:hypothetical protein
MATITVLLTTPEGEVDPVEVPLAAWEAALSVPKPRRQAFLLAQLHRAPQP